MSKIQNSKHFEMILQAMTEGLVQQDQSGKIIFFNQSALSILGLTEDQLLGRTSLDPRWCAVKENGEPFPGEDHPAMFTLKTGKPLQNVVMGIKLPDKTEKWIKINSVPEFKENPNLPDTVFCTFTDITNEKRNLNQLNLVKERIEIATESVGFGVWDWNLKTGILNWDEKMFKIFGVAKENFSGDFTAFAKQVHSEDIIDVQTQLAETFQERKSDFKSDFRITTSSGELKYVAATAKCFYSENGEVERLVGFNWDTTIEKLNELEKERLMHWLSTTLNSTKHLLISTDLFGRINMYNAGAEEQLLYKQWEVINKDISQLIKIKDSENPQSRPALISEIIQLNKKSLDLEMWFIERKDKNMFPIRMSASPLYDQQKNHTGYLIVAEDITEEVEMRKKIKDQELLMTSQLKMASLGEMAGGIAHEINNPLAIIRGRANQLSQFSSKNNYDHEKFSSYLDIIMQTTDRIAKIIKGLQLFSRNADHEIMELANLKKIINDTLILCNEKLKNSDINIIIDESHDIDFYCRPVQISQVLLNLINNSYDALQNLNEKWIRLDIEIIDNQFFNLILTDSGRGISTEFQEKIMQPFFTTKDVGKGTGLGLSISKGLIEDHGGKLLLDNANKNTSFKIQLPYIKLTSKNKAI